MMKFKYMVTMLLLSLVFTACSKKKVADEESIDDIAAIDDGAGDLDNSGLAPGARIPGVDVVYFDYNSFSVRSDARSRLSAAAEYLKANPNQNVQVEGHADERGTTEYNLALGEKRAAAVYDYLISQGVPASQLSTISYGEERPAVPGSDESAYSQNRRAEFVAPGY